MTKSVSFGYGTDVTSGGAASCPSVIIGNCKTIGIDASGSVISPPVFAAHAAIDTAHAAANTIARSFFMSVAPFSFRICKVKRRHSPKAPLAGELSAAG